MADDPSSRGKHQRGPLGFRIIGCLKLAGGLLGFAAWLGMFRLLREANLRMFARLTSEQWERHGIHSERGKLTVRELCRHMAAHDINHIEQVRRILAG